MKRSLFALCLLSLLVPLNACASDVKLKTSDGRVVYGDFKQAKPNNDRIVLLFHQARSNRHEYDPIAPAINKIGFDTLAIDQRSGGNMWGETNQTVAAAGNSTGYTEAFPDLQAAVDWAVAKKYKTIVTVGSSYSSALNFFLAKKNADKITAMASFSPGEYLGGGEWTVANAAKGLKMAVYVTSASSDQERASVDAIVSEAGIKRLTRAKPTSGVHGASTMRRDRNPRGYQENLAHFIAFLKSL